MKLKKMLLKERSIGQEDEDEDGSGYWIITRKRESAGTWKRKC